MWLIYDEGGKSLHKELFNIKGLFINGTREYIIENNQLYTNMLNNIKILKQIIISLASVIIYSKIIIY